MRIVFAMLAQEFAMLKILISFKLSIVLGLEERGRRWDRVRMLSVSAALPPFPTAGFW